MSVFQPQVVGTPIPVPTFLSRPYWEGCRLHELRYQRCSACGTVPPLPLSMCPHCLTSTLVWERSTGRGSLYSWTVVWRPQHPAFEVPYAPAIVELEEGARMMSAIVGTTPEELRAGLGVEVEFHQLDDEITLPFFHPA